MDPLSPIFVYLDNSNIFISTQSYSSKVNNYKEGIQDVQCRMNTSKMLELVLGGRTPTLKKAYGHMNKEVKYELEKIGFAVFLSDSIHGEKEVDTQLTADAVEDLLRHHLRSRSDQREPQKGTLILLSGDKDMRPLIKVARKIEWDVEVWAYAFSLAGAMQIEMERKEYGSMMEVKPLEEYFNEFVFYEDKNMEIQKERSLLVRFRDEGARLKEMDDETKTMISNIIKEAAKLIFRLPIVAKLAPIGQNQEVAVAVILVLEEFKGKRPLYKFQGDVLDKLMEFETEVKTRMLRKFGVNDLYVTRYEDKSGSGSNQQSWRNHGSLGSNQQSWRNHGTAVPRSHGGNETSRTDKDRAYKTKRCSKKLCPNASCFYAHSEAELRCYNCSGNHDQRVCSKLEGPKPSVLGSKV